MKDHSDCCSRNRFPVPAIIAMVLGGLALAVVVAFLFGWIVIYLWNWLMPDIFGLRTITYWQAWGLVVLSHILFGRGWGAGDDKKCTCENDSEKKCCDNSGTASE